VSTTIPLRLPPEDKLDAIRYLDEFRYWHSLDDERRCERCGRVITGRQIVILELHGTRGKLRLQCPTPGCVSSPSDWVYANPVRAAKLGAGARASRNASKPESLSNERIHYRGGSRTRSKKRRPGAQQLPAGKKRRSQILIPALSFRAVLARLVSLRPRLTALHVFRPVA